MNAPEYPCDINQEWVEFVLNDYEKKQQPLSTVSVNNFTLSNGLIAGEGFAGQLIMLDVESTLSTEKESIKKDYHLMVKLMDASGMDREMNRRMSADVREMKMYKEVIPELNRFAKSHSAEEFCLTMPGIIYGKCTEDQFVLVMENLKFQQFDTLPNGEGLSYTQLMMAIEYLAKLHALSYSYDKTYGFLGKFPCYKNDYMTDLNFGLAKYEGLMNAKMVLNTIVGSEDLLKRIGSAEERLMKDYDDGRRQVTAKSIMCLTHSDLWTKNIMYKLNKNEYGDEITEDIHILDWQRAYWNTSVFDLQFLIYTSTTQQVRSQHLEEILQHYHSLFIMITKRMGIANEWSYVDFKEEYNRLQSFGLLRGLMATQFTLSEVSKQYKGSKESSGLISAPSSVMRSVNNYLAKFLTTVRLTRLGQHLFNKFIRYMFGLGGKEMINGENPIMRKRVLDIIYDADDNSLFDYNSN